MDQNRMDGSGRQPAPGMNDWVSCGIPENRSDHAQFWLRWARAKDSRKCPCGEMVPGGVCPVCGRGADDAERDQEK